VSRIDPNGEASTRIPIWRYSGAPVPDARRRRREAGIFRAYTVLGITIATVFVATLCGLAARGMLPVAVPAVYLAASLATAVAYGIDKAAAQSGAWRTSERTLHVLALLGGWPGALIAQRVFRHKSRKASFRFEFWATVALNCAALAWWWRMAG
jgi:uncharacterized membrane protein YsdA (DUF1294 family)